MFFFFFDFFSPVIEVVVVSKYIIFQKTSEKKIPMSKKTMSKTPTRDAEKRREACQQQEFRKVAFQMLYLNGGTISDIQPWLMDTSLSPEERLEFCAIIHNANVMNTSGGIDWSNTLKLASRQILTELTSSSASSTREETKQKVLVVATVAKPEATKSETKPEAKQEAKQ